MLKAIFKRQRFDARTPDVPHEPTDGDAWTDALIADLETLQTAAVDDGPNFCGGNGFIRVRQIR